MIDMALKTMLRNYHI